MILSFLFLIICTTINNDQIDALLRQLDLNPKEVNINFYQEYESPFNSMNSIGILHFYVDSDSLFYDKHLEMIVYESEPVILEFEKTSHKILRAIHLPYKISNDQEAPWREPFITLDNSVSQSSGIDSVISILIDHHTQTNDNFGYQKLILLKPYRSTFRVLFNSKIHEYYHYQGSDCISYLQSNTDSIYLNKNDKINGDYTLNVLTTREKYISIEECQDTSFFSRQLAEWTIKDGQYEFNGVQGDKLKNLWENDCFECNAIKAIKLYREDKQSNKND